MGDLRHKTTVRLDMPLWRRAKRHLAENDDLTVESLIAVSLEEYLSRAVGETPESSQPQMRVSHPQEIQINPGSISKQTYTSQDMLSPDPAHAALAAILDGADPEMVTAVRTLLERGAAMVATHEPGDRTLSTDPEADALERELDAAEAEDRDVPARRIADARRSKQGA